MEIADEKRVLNYLERIGYYRLSGYWYPFRNKNEKASLEEKRLVLQDTFKPQTCFTDVLNLYIFDKKLRLLILDALERIEMAIKNDVVHLLGKLNPLAHIEPFPKASEGNSTPKSYLHGNFLKKVGNEPSKYEKWLEKHNSLVARSQKRDCIKHYKNEYGGKLPIWVSAEVWDFGLLSQLFSGMRYQDKAQIAQKYGIEGKTLEQWLRSLNFIRNVCAHHTRLWNLNIVNASALPKDLPNINTTRIFLYLCIIQKMLLVICPNSTWGERLKALMTEFPTPNNQAVSEMDMGIVAEWNEWDIWKKKA